MPKIFLRRSALVPVANNELWSGSDETPAVYSLRDALKGTEQRLHIMSNVLYF